MATSRATILLSTVSAISAAGLARRTEGEPSQILNQYDYPMVKEGDYLVWKGSVNAPAGLQFSEYPNTDEAGQFMTEDGKCLVLKTSNDFPVIDLDDCNGQLFTPIGDTNELRIEDPTIGVCGDYENGFETCSLEESSDLCVSDDEGYIAVRPCDGYVARVENAKVKESTSIQNSFDYYMTWSGEYLEWKGMGETVVFTEYPATGEAGVFRTANDTCLVIRETNGFPVLKLGGCDFQQFMPMENDELKIVNPPIGVCGDVESGFEPCSLDESDDLCVGDDEGYVGVRPCTDYIAKLSNPK